MRDRSSGRAKRTLKCRETTELLEFRMTAKERASPKVPHWLNGTNSWARSFRDDHESECESNSMFSPSIRGAATLLPVRLAVGLGFLMHGIAKYQRGPEKFAKLLQFVGTPLPLPTAWVVTLLEICGGLALIAGAFVALVSLPLIVAMLVAAFTINGRYGFSAVNTIGLTSNGPVFGPPGYEINMLYIAALIALSLAGPTVASVDEWRSRRR
jgi:putative oxidoreductase